MIATLRGKIVSKTRDAVVIDVSGLGLEINIAPSTSAELPALGSETIVYVSESVAMYGGGTALYGFVSSVEKDIFGLLREMPGTGAKKALEYFEKIKKSPADFKKAVLAKDHAALTSLFGFRKPTAEKLAVNLKDKIDALDIPAPAARQSGPSSVSVRAEAIAVLVALGYRDGVAREAVDEALALPDGGLAPSDVQRIVKAALKKL